MQVISKLRSVWLNCGARLGSSHFYRNNPSHATVQGFDDSYAGTGKMQAA